jgi:hypothetical protein
MSNTFGSLFAGVGGFDLGMESAGWNCEWQVEWDKHCQSVLRKHWPTVPKYFDIRDVDGSKLTPVDCIVFGSPCQDLSIAGKGGGLEGSRSGLFHEAIRVIKEMSQVPSVAIKETTSQRSLTKWQTSGHWRLNGTSWMHNGSESPREEGVSLCLLATILEPLQDVPNKYYLSPKTAKGILNRAGKKGNELPKRLRQSLENLASMVKPDTENGQKAE